MLLTAFIEVVYLIHGKFRNKCPYGHFEDNGSRTNFGGRCGTVCLLHRLADGIWPSQLDQISADSKGNWYWLAWKKMISSFLH